MKTLKTLLMASLLCSGSLMAQKKAQPLVPVKAVEEVDAEALESENEEAIFSLLAEESSIARKELQLEKEEVAQYTASALGERTAAERFDNELAWRVELLLGRIDQLNNQSRELNEQGIALLEENESIIEKDAFVNEEEEVQINDNVSRVAAYDSIIADNLNTLAEDEQLLEELQAQLQDNEERLIAADETVQDCDAMTAYNTSDDL